MPIALESLLLTGGVFLLAAFVQGFTGFGSALVAIPLLSLFLEVKQAVPLCVLAGLVITGALALDLRRALARRKLAPLFLGALPGIGLGVLLLERLPGTALRAALGGLLVFYALCGLSIRPRGRRLHPAWAWLAGFLSGLLGTSLSTIGPPAVVFTSLTDWSKDEIKATLSGFFLAAGLVTASVHLATGRTTLEVLALFAAALPASLLGVLLGLRLSRRSSDRDYRRWMFGLLALLGIGLLVF